MVVVPIRNVAGRQRYRQLHVGISTIGQVQTCDCIGICLEGIFQEKEMMAGVCLVLQREMPIQEPRQEVLAGQCEAGLDAYKSPSAGSH